MKFIFSHLFVLLILSVSPSIWGAEATPRLLIHLLDYIALDYGGAVENGKVVAASEYAEQLEFAQSAIHTAEAISELKSSPQINQKLHQLKQSIDDKFPATEVQKLARNIENEVIHIAKVPLAPQKWPSLHKGKENFDKNCALCHGMSGHGDGPSGGGLNPKPANFFDAKADHISPFQMFNAIRLGVPGTAMASFDYFSDSDTWDLAFYIASLRHGGMESARLALPRLPLEEIASKSDAELKQSGITSTEIQGARLYHAVELGEEGQINLIRSYLNETALLFKKGNFEAAKTKAIAAYLDGVEPIEPKLRLKNSLFTATLESKMALLRNQIDQRVAFDQFNSTITAIESQLGEALQILTTSTSSAGVTFAVSAGIILREAFEAALLLITLLGVIRTLGSGKAALYVHGGWILAVAFGVLCWFFSGWIMRISGMQRELLEGSTALLAVIILIYFGYWLHRKSEIGKWHQFINEMVTTAMTQQKLFGLGLVAFMGVFREAFETVLFLRALLLQSPEQENALYAGVVAAFAMVLVLSMVAVRFSTRLPIQKLFSLSSATMVFLAFILVGKSVHSFQEAGLVRMSEFPIALRFDWLGIYSSYETLVPQFILIILTWVVWKLSYASKKISSNE